MNRVDRIVLDPIRTYACTRTARTGVRVTLLCGEELEDEIDGNEMEMGSILTFSSQGAMNVVHKNEAAQMNITMADTDDTSEVNEEIELSQVVTCDTMDLPFQLQRAERVLLIFQKKKTII